MIKKIFLLLLVSLFLFTSIKVSKINAANTTYSDNQNGQWTPNRTEETNIFGMEHLSVYGVANKSNLQHINVLSMKTDGYSSKLVTWSVLDGNKKYTRQTLDKIAEDYEKTHPGWIVIGGINGDQYTTGFGSDIGAGSAYFTPQTYYPLIMDGESRIPYTVLNNYNMHVGFTNNGATDSLVDASPVVGYQLHIIDEYKNEIATFSVDKINEAPSVGQTTAWSTYSSISKLGDYINRVVESNNDIYVVENPELAYMSNCVEYGGVNSLFGRGVISKVDKNHNLIFNQFAIETTNPELQSALGVGTRIIVEAKYQDEALNKVEASTGFHSVHRYNNVDQPLVHTDYDGNRYSRAIVGQKADGTYVLLTVDVATDPNDLMIRYPGMGFDECNATLKHYGVVEAYQMDGGGSVTSILRNENGGFDITNFPRDGVRANMTGLLYVVRSPELLLESSNYHSITFKNNPIINGINSTVENIKVTHDNKEYFVQDGKIVVDGLKEDTHYVFDCSYDVVSKDGSKQTFTTKISGTTTLYNEQTANFSVQNISKYSFDVVKETNDNIKNVLISANDTIYRMTDDKVTIDELVGGTSYNVEITYDIYDPITGNTYSRSALLESVTTKTFEVPNIVKFEIYRQTSKRVTFSYEYQDADGVVLEAYLEGPNGNEKVTSARGTIAVNDLELDKQEYAFKFIVVYKDGEEDIYIHSDEIKLGTKIEEPVEIKHSITFNSNGGVLENAPSEYVEGVGLNDLPEPTKEGYIFIGWYKGEEKVESIPSSYKEDVVLTAKWEAIKQEEPTPTPVPTPTPSETKKGCGCGKNSAYFVMLSVLLSCCAVLFRKRK